MKHATLCYLIKGKKVCLGLKKRGFGAGRWNGFGGKVENGELVEKAVAREVLEETGVTVKNIEKAAELDFYFPKVPKEKEWDQKVHVYVSFDWEGKPIESEEMKPEWFEFSTIPYDLSWPDDTIWLPHVLAGKKVRGKFSFGEEDKILNYEFKIVDKL